MQYKTFNTYENIQDNLLENIIDKYECYICYEKLELNKDLFIKNNKLLKLNYCNCTELHIHKKCLLKWIDTKKEQNDQKYRYCEICNNLYKINKKFKLYKNKKFIHDFIILYKDLYLLSVTKKLTKKKHESVKEILLNIIKKYNS